MTQVQIGGEPITLGDFSGYKAGLVLSAARNIMKSAPEILDEVARFKRQYSEANYVELARAEARRQFRPAVVYRDVIARDEETKEVLRDGDGVVVIAREPFVGRDGEPVIGPDPLGHLTDADWAASGEVLRIPRPASEELQWAVMVPVVFDLAREQVLRLLAAVVTSNRDFEEWDLEGGDAKVDAELEQAAKSLQHRARGDELVRLAGATVELLEEQFLAALEESRSRLGGLRRIFNRQEKAPAPSAPEPTRMETSPSEQTGSTPSPGDTEEAPETGSTEPAGALAGS